MTSQRNQDTISNHLQRKFFCLIMFNYIGENI